MSSNKISVNLSVNYGCSVRTWTVYKFFVCFLKSQTSAIMLANKTLYNNNAMFVVPMQCFWGLFGYLIYFLWKKSLFFCIEADIFRCSFFFKQ